MFCPPDAAEVTRRWETAGRGACGPCAAAALLGSLLRRRMSAEEILRAWRRVHEEEYPGYAGTRKLRAVIEALGFDTLQQPAKPHDYSWPALEEGQCALVAVVWHPRGEWRHWAEKESHWVAFVQSGAGALVYCNGYRHWRTLEAMGRSGYLDGAHVSSYLLVEKKSVTHR